MSGYWLLLEKLRYKSIGKFKEISANRKSNRVLNFRKARIAVLSTGNELQDPHETLKPGHVRDTNRLTLLSLLKQYGHAPSDCGIVRDT